MTLPSSVSGQEKPTKQMIGAMCIFFFDVYYECPMFGGVPSCHIPKRWCIFLSFLAVGYLMWVASKLATGAYSGKPSIFPISFYALLECFTYCRFYASLVVLSYFFHVKYT